MNYSYYIVELKPTVYLGARRGQEVYELGLARCYKTRKAAEKAAQGLDCVPYYQPRAMGRVAWQNEFGGKVTLAAEPLQ